MRNQKIDFGTDVWIWTFTGWEKFDWDSLAFETSDDAFEALSTFSEVTTKKPM